MRLGQTSLVHFISRFLASLLGFLGTIYLARLVGSEGLGVFFLVMGVVSWLAIVGEFGINGAITKRVSEGEERSAHVAAGVLLEAALFVVITPALVLAKPQIDAYVGYPAAEFVIVLLFVRVLYGVVTSVLSGVHMVHVNGILAPLKTGTRTVFQVGAVLVGLGVTGLFVGQIAGVVLVTIIGGTIVLRRLDGIRRPEARHVRSLVTYAKFSWVGKVKSKAYNWVDVVILGFFVSSGLIGVYSIAWNISQFLALFGSSLSTTLFPEMSKVSTDRGLDAVADLFESALAYAGLLLIPGLVGGTLLADRLLRLYGDDFVRGTAVLSILILATLVRGYQKQFTTTFNAVDRPDVAFRINGIFIVTNLALNVVLIYSYGWVGAAAATASSLVISLCAAYVALDSILEFSVPFDEIGRQWVAAGVMGAVVYAGDWLETTYSPVGHNAIVVVTLVALGAGTYFVVLFGISSRFRTTVLDNVPFEVRSATQ